MRKFEKVSIEQYAKDKNANDMSEVRAEYDAIRLPRSATKGSAGYDFFSPVSFTLKPGETILLPTGIRVILNENETMLCFPRSSLGFKYRMQLDNTVGVIDSDYWKSDNEGHIFLKITNDNRNGKVCEIQAGHAIMQGIVIPYLKMDDDDVTEERNGGIGSTDKITTIDINTSQQSNEELSMTENEHENYILEEAYEEYHEYEDIQPEEPDIQENNKVILYSTHCPNCNALMHFLDSRKIEYEMITDPDAIESVASDAGLMSVPLLKVGSNVMAFAAAVKWVKTQDGK